MSSTTPNWTPHLSPQASHITLETNLFRDGWVESVNQAYELLAGQIVAATDCGASGKPPPIDIGDFADTCLLCYAVLLHSPTPPEQSKSPKKKRERWPLHLPRRDERQVTAGWSSERTLTLMQEFEREKRDATLEVKWRMDQDAKSPLEALADDAFRTYGRGKRGLDLSDDEEEDDYYEEKKPEPNPMVENVIGLVYLRTTPHNSEATVGVSILPPWRGEGHAATAVERTLNQAFGLFGFHRVVASIPESVVLHRAVRTFMRLGFAHEGVRRKASFCPFEQTWKDITSLALLDTDYAIREARARAGGVVARSPWDELMDRHERERNALMDNEALQPSGSFDGMFMEEMVMQGGKLVVKRTKSMETVRNVGVSANRSAPPGRALEMKRISQAIWDESPAPTPSASASECSSPPRSSCPSLPDSPRAGAEDISMDDDDDDDLYMDSKTPASGGEDLRKIWADAVGSGSAPKPNLSPLRPSGSSPSSPTRSSLPTQRAPPTSPLPPLPTSPTSPIPGLASTSLPPPHPAFTLAQAASIRDIFSDPEDDSEIDWEEVSESDSISVIASDLDGSVAGSSESGSYVSSGSGVRSLASDGEDDEDAQGEDDV